MLFRLQLLVVFGCISHFLPAQDTSRTLLFDGYAEGYACIDFGKPASGQRQDFLYSYNRDRLPQFNLVYLRAKQEMPRFRSSLALMTGTYAQENLSGEPALLQTILECSGGFRLRRQNNIWLDAGVFPSHIGFESAAGKDCAALTRSMMAENSPYFESGLRLSAISKNEKWQGAFLLLNGWQKIRINTREFVPAAGTQISFEASKKLRLSSSSYAGFDNHHGSGTTRLFHDFYVQWNPVKKMNLAAAYDLGFEASAVSGWHHWHCGLIQMQYAFLPRWKACIRSEFFSDPDHRIIDAFPTHDFRVKGGSLNIDFLPEPVICIRAEYRLLQSSHPDFTSDSGATAYNHCATMALYVIF